MTSAPTPSRLPAASMMRALAWWHDQLDVLQRDVGLLQRLEGRLGEDFGGEAENLATVHADFRTAAALRAVGAGRDIDKVAAGAVRSEHRGLDARAVRARAQHDGARAVTEDDAGATVLEIEDLGERLAADHDRLLRVAARDEAVGHAHRVKETRAGRLHVECRTVGAQPLLYAGRD